MCIRDSANWALFGGAVLIDGKDFVDSVGYMVNAAGQILTSNNVVLGHFVNAVTIDDPTKLVPFADILAQFAANGNAASIILEDAFLKNGAVYTATGAMLATAGKTISAGLLDYLYLGVKLGIYPCLIFMGVGAGTDFGPLISNPKTLLLGVIVSLFSALLVTRFLMKQFIQLKNWNVSAFTSGVQSAKEAK